MKNYRQVGFRQISERSKDVKHHVLEEYVHPIVLHTNINTQKIQLR